MPNNSKNITQIDIAHNVKLMNGDNFGGDLKRFKIHPANMPTIVK